MVDLATKHFAAKRTAASRRGTPKREKYVSCASGVGTLWEQELGTFLAEMLDLTASEPQLSVQFNLSWAAVLLDGIAGATFKPSSALP